mmetsp:Transcript_55168/g.178816  ORF Transcript_55168/g.178816 Transcript_55168/m.178816 type:complete len:199 (+) Transcript_55168:45-641(+)
MSQDLVPGGFGKHCGVFWSLAGPGPLWRWDTSWSFFGRLQDMAGLWSVQDVAGAAARPAGALGRSFEPAEPADFVRAFESVLRRPPDLLQDLLGLRAQVIPRDTLMRIAPLVEDSDCLGPDAFSGPFAEALRPLVVFLHAVVESGEIYAEIQDSVAAGRFDKQQAASLMEGEVSDQRRMINAMGVRGFEENELQDGYE